MEKLLFLDDDRMPIERAPYMYLKVVDCSIYHKEWHIVRTYKQFTEWITKNGLPDVISFDHDIKDTPTNRAKLSDEERDGLDPDREYTGMDCAHWLTRYCMDYDLPLPRCIAHTENNRGSENIEGLFKSFLKSYKK